MIIGILSDTHEDKMRALPHIVADMRKRGVEVILHCGDIVARHLDPNLFGGLPVFCALTEDQLDLPEFKNPPDGWIFTRPGKRIIRVGGLTIYLGHKRSFDFLANSEAQVKVILQRLRMETDGLTLVCSGHTHHQILLGGLVRFVNPGAVVGSLFDHSYEYAVFDTEREEIIFCRILADPIIDQKTFSLAVISDSFDVSKRDEGFWKKLAEQLYQRDVSTIIHCGNIDPVDIGHPDLSGFKVFFNLTAGQAKPGSLPENWFQISKECPIVEVYGHYFYVDLELSTDLQDQSDADMNRLCRDRRTRFGRIDYVLTGTTTEPLMDESEWTRIISPGDVRSSRDFVVICLPRHEITFSNIPRQPLPPLT